MNFVCDNDECTAITPTLYAAKELGKWLCEDCWWKLADVKQGQRKKVSSMEDVHKIYRLSDKRREKLRELARIRRLDKKAIHKHNNEAPQNGV